MCILTDFVEIYFLKPLLNRSQYRYAYKKARSNKKYF